jgi:hypothetical protein
MARLSHPNIVSIHDFGEVDGLYFFLMEHVDGVDLKRLEQSRQLTPEQALAIVPRICDALQYAHEEGIVHRDVKPGNILVDKKGRVKIADFGLAKLLGRSMADLSLTRSGQLMGTPHYMAPEQIDRPQQVDHRADIYSLGVVFYEMLTGELPVGRFAAPSTKVQVDVRLDDVVLRALENSPERRYQQASDVRTDVESIAKSPPPRLVPEPPPAGTAFPAPPSADRSNRAMRIVNAPGLALMIYGIVNLVGLFLSTGILPRALPWGLSRGLALPTRLWWFPEAWLGFNPMFTLATLSAAICLVVGASKLRNLSSYNWALTAAILAMIPLFQGSLWLIGLALGIWALVAMHQPEVKAAFGSEPRDPARRATWAGAPADGNRMTSPKAIVGACLLVASLALTAVVTMPLQARSGIETLQLTHPSTTFLFQILVLPLWLVLPMTATVLGVLAIQEIRYSKGRIAGLPLALTDALVFPLLVLNGFLLMLLRGGEPFLHPIWPWSNFHFGAFPNPVLALLLCAGVDYLVVRACWRAARRPVPC